MTLPRFDARGRAVRFAAVSLLMFLAAAISPSVRAAPTLLERMQSLRAGESFTLPAAGLGSDSLVLETDAPVMLRGTVHFDGHLILVSPGGITLASTAEIRATRVDLRVPAETGPPASPATSSAALSVLGRIEARGATLDAPAGVTRIEGVLDVSNDTGSGGEIRVLGRRVEIAPTAHLNGDGATGGGLILVGGDYRGANPAIANAARSAVAAGARLSANATASGPGGRVIVWADELTRFAGSIAARGGAQSGDGGFVEVSSQGHLAFRGAVDLLAPAGRTGELLLDPDDIIIATASPDLNGDEVRGDDIVGNISATDYQGMVSVITAGEIANLLLSANLSLAATNSITVNSALSWSSARTLTLTTTAANSSIAINAPITNSGAGGVALNSAGAIIVGANITTAGIATFDAVGQILTSAGTVSVANLHLRGAGNIGSASAPLAINTNFLVLAKSAGDTFVREANQIYLQGSTAGALSVESLAGSIEDGNDPLSVGGVATFITPLGNASADVIFFANGNRFCDLVHIRAGGRVDVWTSGSLALGRIQAGGTVRVNFGANGIGVFNGKTLNVTAASFAGSSIELRGGSGPDKIIGLAGPLNWTSATAGANGSVTWTDVEQIENTNLVGNSGFETAASVDGNPPGVAGQWFSDANEIVTAQNGIAPAEGTRMLRFVHTSPGNTQAGSSSDTMQIIDVSAAATQIAAGNFYATFSARVNRVAGNSQTDTQFMLTIRAFNGSLSTHDFARSSVAAKSVTLLSDGDPATWQTIGTALTLPAGTTYVVAVLSAVENVTDNPHTGTEFDGHYADDAKFFLGTGESQPVTLNALGDVAQTAAASKLHATSSLPLPIAYSVVSGPATVSGNTLSLTGAGSVTVAASQAGTGFIAPATTQRTFTSVPTAQVLHFTDFSTFTTGEFVGFNGWSGTHPSGAGSGVFTQFSNPTGFVGFETTVADALVTLRRPISFDPVSGTYPQVNFSVDLSVAASTNNRADAFTFRFANLAGATLATIRFDNNGNYVRHSTAAGGTTTTAFRYTNGQLYTFRVALNLGTNRWSAWIGDTALFTDQTINSLGAALTLRDIAVDWSMAARGTPGNNYVTLNRYLLWQDKGFQTLTFTPPADLINLTTTPILLSATSTSGLPVTFSVFSGPATISGSNLTLTGTGTVVIRATQAGNASYNAAPSLDRTITVVPVGFQTSAAASTRPILITEPGNWTASTAASWITLPVASGTGPRMLDLSFAANETGADRSTTLTIGGTSYNITQRAAGSGLRELWVAGSNELGELGLGQAPAPRHTPTLVATGMQAASLSRPSAYFLGNDGTLWGTGDNREGQLGLGDTAPRTGLQPIATRVIQVIASENNYSVLFLTDDGTLWGAGVLSSLTDSFASHTRPIPLATGVARFSLGYSYAAYVKTDGTLWTAGNNSSGQLGDGTTTLRTSFAQVATGVAAVACGGNHLTYLKTDRTLWTVGANSNGELGTGNTTARSSAGQIATDVAFVAAGGNHTAFVKTDGTLWVHGGNSNGQLGLGDTTRRLSPVQLGTGFARVFCSNGTTFAVKSGSTPALWVAGNNFYGQLGRGSSVTPGNQLTLIEHPSIPAVTHVTHAHARTLFTLPDGRVLASGYAGGLPDVFGSEMSINRSNDCTTDYRPFLTPAADGIATVVARANGNGGTGHMSFLLRSDGVLTAIGNTSWGNFGDGLQSSTRRTAYQVATGVRSVSVGGYHTLFVKPDNTLWGTGWNGTGVLGTGNTTNQFTPVQLATDVASVAAGQSHTVILKTDGTLWTTGNNAVGQLGDGLTAHRTSFVQVASGVASVSSQFNHTLFVKHDGTLWGFGYNTNGELGDNSTTHRRSPIQISTGVTAAWAGEIHSLFLKSDGTLWGMGHNGYGQLGLGATPFSRVAVQIASGVSSASASTFHSLILKTDGTVWATGQNTYGQLGDGTTTNRNVPVQVAANALAVIAGGASSFIIGRDRASLTTRPEIIAQPGNVTVASGGSANLAVLVTGNPAPTYQWFKDGLQLANQTANTLSLANLSPSTAGTYTVRVSNPLGGFLSSPATVTIAIGFDAWRLANFSANDSNNAAVSGPLVIGPSGLSNLVRYALGLDAAGQPAAHLPAAATLNDDWTYTYTRPTDRPDLTYTVQYSTDLGTWQTSGVTTEQIASTSTHQTHRARVAKTFAPTAIFFRLKITH